MGLFFEQQAGSSSLTELLADALMAAVPPTADEAEKLARERAPEMTPVVDGVKAALMHESITDPVAARAEAHDRAAAITRSLTGPPRFCWQRFAVGLVLFVAVLAAAIATDATHLTLSPTALFSLATTILGLLVGQLSGESSRS
jgi:hypothetical protein